MKEKHLKVKIKRNQFKNHGPTHSNNVGTKSNREHVNIMTPYQYQSHQKMPNTRTIRWTRWLKPFPKAEEWSKITVESSGGLLWWNEVIRRLSWKEFSCKTWGITYYLPHEGKLLRALKTTLTSLKRIKCFDNEAQKVFVVNMINNCILILMINTKGIPFCKKIWCHDYWCGPRHNISTFF